MNHNCMNVILAPILTACFMDSLLPSFALQPLCSQQMNNQCQYLKKKTLISFRAHHQLLFKMQGQRCRVREVEDEYLLSLSKHDVIQICNNVFWDRQYFMEYFRMFSTFNMNVGIFWNTLWNIVSTIIYCYGYELCY